MTFQDVATMLNTVGVPTAYYQFDDTGAELPFICFYFSGDNDLKADDTNYQKIENLVVELYTQEKDFELEATLEEVLTAAGLVYSRQEVRIDSENMYQIVYETNVMITKKEVQNGEFES